MHTERLLGGQYVQQNEYVVMPDKSKETEERAWVRFCLCCFTFVRSETEDLPYSPEKSAGRNRELNTKITVSLCFFISFYKFMFDRQVQQVLRFLCKTFFRDIVEFSNNVKFLQFLPTNLVPA